MDHTYEYAKYLVEIDYKDLSLQVLSNLILKKYYLIDNTIVEYFVETSDLQDDCETVYFFILNNLSSFDSYFLKEILPLLYNKRLYGSCSSVYFQLVCNGNLEYVEKLSDVIDSSILFNDYALDDEGTEISMDGIVQLYEEAADLGYIKLYEKLGDIYSDDSLKFYSLEDAARCYLQACFYDENEVQNKFALFLKNNFDENEFDEYNIIGWFQNVSESGNQFVGHMLAEFYEDGRYGIQNTSKSYQIYSESSYKMSNFNSLVMSNPLSDDPFTIHSIFDLDTFCYENPEYLPYAKDYLWKIFEYYSRTYYDITVEEFCILFNNTLANDYSSIPEWIDYIDYVLDVFNDYNKDSELSKNKLKDISKTSMRDLNIALRPIDYAQGIRKEI